MRRLLAALIAFPAVALCTLESPETDAGDPDRFALFTQCAPVQLADFWFGPVLDMDAGDAEHRAMAEARLRAENIWNEEEWEPGKSFVLGTAADGSVAWFAKEVYDPLSGETQVMNTWELHSWELDPPRQPVTVLDISDDPSQRMAARELVNALTDRFIIEYLQVNEEHCR